MTIKLTYILSFITVLFFSSEECFANTLLQDKVLDTVVYDSSQLQPRAFSNLTETYKDKAFNYQTTEASSGWWTRFKQWLSTIIKDLLNLQDKGKASKFTNYMLSTGAFIICVLVIYFIFKAVINKEGKWVFGKSSDDSILPITSVEKELKNTDFKTLIASAEKENNYRLAIRYYYLWLLKALNEAEVIAYDPDKTNSDYQYEIKKNELRESFAYTSYLYNYIWYGEFNVDQTQFNKAKTAFSSLLNTVKL